MAKHLVSVIVATHNRKRLVMEAVDSLLADRYARLEVLVVDDGSSDGTYEALNARYKEDERVWTYRLEDNCGPGCARNYGIAKARGEFVTFLDDDDINISGRIAAQVELAIANNADFVTCTRFYYVVGKALKLRGARVKSVSLKQMWSRNQIVSVTPLVAMELMRKTRFDPRLPAANDYDAWIRCLQHSKRSVNYLHPCIRHRRTSKTVTGSRRKKFIGRLRFWKKHRKAMGPIYEGQFLMMTLLNPIVA